MIPNSLKKFRFVLALLLVGLLSACGNISHNVARDGASAGQLVWPAVTSATGTHRHGSFPVLASLRLIKPGMTKNQIIKLIGAPHFNEGVFGVREWNYVFKFHDPDSDVVAVCQYKILFDEHKLSSSFYWEPAACAERLVVVAPDTEAAAEKVKSDVLSADALFAFDKYSAADIKSDGRDKLDSLAQQIAEAGSDVADITVVGYTDRLGSDAHNATLSKNRADTVMHYLVEKGVGESRLTSDGKGSADPVVQCDEKKRKALITCLAPNRRVVVTVTRP